MPARIARATPSADAFASLDVVGDVAPSHPMYGLLRPAAHVLLTHRHLDHAGGARRFGELVSDPVRATDPE
ncbi:MAG: MBL fold metallo-hydrolase [Gammaproteobacteria bacterium]